MRDHQDLARTLTSIDGRGYASYKQLTGNYDLGHVRLSVDRVQVDPFAPPSLMRVGVSRAEAALPAELLNDRAGEVAVRDFLTRVFDKAARRLVPAGSGSGNSGTLSIGSPRQQVLERTAVVITEDAVEARIAVGLPATGRRAKGRQAARLLTELLPQAAEEALLHRNLEGSALEEHVALHRDQEELRSRLPEAELVAFVGDGAVLPRRAGDSDLPLEGDAVPFCSPDSLRTSFTLSSGRTVTGMGVPAGVTVIVGGGYHGKSTLLRAVERGVYPHIGGDGREWVITRSGASSIRAEDGRAVTGVDISPFISGLPSGTETTSFSTANASGSTSQAANLMEAVEAGATALLIDEDTSATNFMIRDDRMRRLIPAEREPITPFVDRIRPLYQQRGVSTVLVAGGSGAFFDVADHVIALDSYVPRDVTEEVKHLASETPHEPEDCFFDGARPRVPEPRALQPAGKSKPARARGRTTVQFGRDDVDLAAVVQLVDPAQTEAVAKAMDRLAEAAGGDRDLPELVRELFRRLDDGGLDLLSPHKGHPGQLARPRPQEVHAAINRYRGLKLRD